LSYYKNKKCTANEIFKVTTNGNDSKQQQLHRCIRVRLCPKHFIGVGRILGFVKLFESSQSSGLDNIIAINDNRMSSLRYFIITITKCHTDW
jgi:hypothetical protein